MLSRTLSALKCLPPKLRAAALAELTDEEAVQIEHDWGFWGRPEQQWEPGDERYTVTLAGRFWGKSSMGANAIRFMARHPDLCAGMMGLAGRTANETNQDLVREGVLKWSAPREAPRWHRSDKLLEWPSRAPWHGCICRLFSGEKPAGFRGPNMGLFWADELPHWTRAEDSFTTLDLMVRAGPHPTILVTTTPLGVPVIIKLCFETGSDGMPLTDDGGAWIVRDDVRLIRGSSFDNIANAPANYVKTLRRLEGTTLGQQEVHGQILIGVKGAPFKMEWFENCEPEDLPMLSRVVIGVDPSGGGNEIGIVAMGEAVAMENGVQRSRFFRLDDRSDEYEATGWATAVLELWEKWNEHPKAADAMLLVAVEDNFGGDMVESNIELVRAAGLGAKRRWSGVKIKRVKATQNKFKRAELVAGYYENGRVARVGAPRRFTKLEFQMTNADPKKPGADQELDRMDAEVWAMLELTADGSDKGGRGMSGLVGMQDELRRRLGL